MEEEWVTTGKLSAYSNDRTNTLSYWNWLIDNELCTFLLYINGSGHRKVVKFLPMADRYYISVIYQDAIQNTQHETSVTHHTTFGIHLNSEKWFL